MRKILFIGMPGSGKGTQAKLLKQFGFAHISTGDIIRKAFKKKDPLVKKFKASIEKGNYLPDKLIFKLLQKYIPKNKSYILDGAIRTKPQTKFSLKIIDEVIFFKLPKDIAIKRIEKRRKTSKEKRKDDSPETAKKRFEVYFQKTQPVLEILKKKCKKNFHVIDASKSIKEIHKDVLRVLGLR